MDNSIFNNIFIFYKKDFTLDPTTIECTLNTSGTNENGWFFDGANNGWIYDSANSTKERGKETKE